MREYGKTPFIGENGNWWIGDEDTGIFAGEINKTADFIYQINEDGTGYIIRGMNSVYSNDVVIPSEVRGLPVVGIDNYAFYGCSRLTDIYFTGTEEQWNAIEKGTDWDDGTGDYTVHYNYVP